MCQNGEKTTADYIAALEMVGLETLKDKLDYKIGKYGENSTDLSGWTMAENRVGEVLLSDAKMFLLDEPTASMDSIGGIEAVRGYDECHEGSRRHYRNAPAGAGKDRRSDCGHAGRGIVGLGSHEELMENNAYYRQLYDAQSEVVSVNLRWAHTGKAKICRKVHV